MGKELVIGIVIVVILMIIIASVFLILNKSNPISSSIINVSQAYEICNEKSCPIEEVIVEGELTRRSTSSSAVFLLSDSTNLSFSSLLEGHSESIYVSFSPEISSLFEVIKANEENNLLKGGIIKAKVKGLISYQYDANRDFNYLEMTIGLKDIEYILDIRCRKKEEVHIIPEVQDDCFDFSMYKLSASESYNYLKNSKICTENGKEPFGDFSYDIEENYWKFSIDSPDSPGGSNDYCYVSKDKIVFKRKCATGNPYCSEIYLEEQVYSFNSSSINPLCGNNKCDYKSEIQNCPQDCQNIGYEECVNILESEKGKYPSAESESIGASREDEEGNIWIKQENDMWKTDAKKYEGVSWGAELIDKLPGGINYQPDLNQCEKYKVKVGGCAKEGEYYSSVFVYEYPEKCCEGLTEFESGMDTRYTIGDKCYETGMESGNPVGICINCGNGICEDIEDICSCPEDCPNGENSAYTIESFCEYWESSSFKSGCDSGYIVDFESGEKLPICDLC